MRVFACFAGILFITEPLLAQPIQHRDLPPVCVSVHDINKLVVGVSNKGYFGNTTRPEIYGCVLGNKNVIGFEYPAKSRISILSYGGIWIGGLLGSDTLVTVGDNGYFGHYEGNLMPPASEFNSADGTYASIIARSVLKNSSSFHKDAVSEQDLITSYIDTFVSLPFINEAPNDTWDFLDTRLHKPLYLKVEQRTYAWSFAYAEDIVFFDLSITNIGNQPIRDVRIGIQVEAECGFPTTNNSQFHDDICGFIKSVAVESQCELRDTTNIMWFADNNGDPIGGEFTETPLLDSSGYYVKSARDAIGFTFLQPTTENPTWFNWWDDYPFDSDFGPRRRGNFREFRTGGLGKPEGDRNKYYIMGNGEIDYDLVHAASIANFNQFWMYPNQQWMQYYSRGGSIWAVLSVTGFDIPATSTLSIVFAVVAGENLHNVPGNLVNLPDNPDAYYANLDFTDLVENAQWARWIYDNPGIDTDNDGYAGEFRVCVFDSVLDANSNWIATVAETTWYKGDGVPDWRAALPPPTPKMWVTPTFKGINIRFNGQESENTPDIFTKLLDFEGYRIYIARDDRETSYSLLASYDIENYDKYVYNYEKQPEAGWDLLDFPMTLEQIKCAYALSCDDSLFDVFQYRPSFPYLHPQYPESLFYFVRHESNVSEFGVTTPITKRFANAPDPRGKPADSITADYYTDDGYLKFFDYEFTIENIIPTVAYYVSVTAIDFGWPKSNLEPLETSITENAQQVYASVVDPALGEDSLQIVVYPKPYRIDANYRARGFEGLNQDDRWSERVRRIHFANIPPKCTISIFSLDGDLVREIRHDKDPNDPTSKHAEWGLISRNGLRVVSGLYYWVVESDSRTEMGKLVILL